MLYFSASVLNTPPSTSRISRRITLSRVVVLPVKVMRLTKYCSPSCSRIVTFDGRLRRARPPGPRPPARELHVREAGELEVAAAAVDLARLLEALADVLLGVPLAGLQLEERLQEFGLDDRVLPSNFDLADAVARAPR